jgi:hypothetical protein
MMLDELQDRHERPGVWNDVADRPGGTAIASFTLELLRSIGNATLKALRAMQQARRVRRFRGNADFRGGPPDAPK